MYQSQRNFCLPVFTVLTITTDIDWKKSNRVFWCLATTPDKEMPSWREWGKERASQGDQIGRFFAHCVIVSFEKYFESCGSSPNLRATFFPRLNLCIKLVKKWVGQHFGRCFQKTHPVTLEQAEDNMPSRSQFLDT
jgi:hypothetical protein